jgi:hypothetical protein
MHNQDGIDLSGTQGIASHSSWHPASLWDMPLHVYTGVNLCCKCAKTLNGGKIRVLMMQTPISITISRFPSARAQLTSRPSSICSLSPECWSFLFIYFNFYLIHMCIQCLGHFSPLPPTPSLLALLPPSPPLPPRYPAETILPLSLILL